VATSTGEREPFLRSPPLCPASCRLLLPYFLAVLGGTRRKTKEVQAPVEGPPCAKAPISPPPGRPSFGALTRWGAGPPPSPEVAWWADRFVALVPASPVCWPMFVCSFDLLPCTIEVGKNAKKGTEIGNAHRWVEGPRPRTLTTVRPKGQRKAVFFRPPRGKKTSRRKGWTIPRGG